ncbi:homeobox-leucine zipper protein HOX32-like [Solanum pennellii]|uniref:Homeobox-leucine zipper protein HOX32-like n=1 Tax=Solanum pennellii TaxID=28526 RepID=A0ABM1V320_SOLPN|nr:homeobox-leucine zipper protein HOX32-like [Solanum pennellii]
MLETTLLALEDIMLDKIVDEAGRKVLLSEFSKIMQQGFAYLLEGIFVSSMGRPILYEQAIAWKVLNGEYNFQFRCANRETMELYSRAKAQQEEILYLREQIALARH